MGQIYSKKKLLFTQSSNLIGHPIFLLVNWETLHRLGCWVFLLQAVRVGASGWDVGSEGSQNWGKRLNGIQVEGQQHLPACILSFSSHSPPPLPFQQGDLASPWRAHSCWQVSQWGLLFSVSEEHWLSIVLHCSFQTIHLLLWLPSLYSLCSGCLAIAFYPPMVLPAFKGLLTSSLTTGL